MNQKYVLYNYVCSQQLTCLIKFRWNFEVNDSLPFKLVTFWCLSLQGLVIPVYLLFLQLVDKICDLTEVMIDRA